MVDVEDFVGKDLNIERIIMFQIIKVTEAYKIDQQTYVKEVDSLDNITSSWYKSEDYDKEVEVINEQTRRKLDGLRNPKDIERIRQAHVERANKVFRAIMRLLRRAGFMKKKYREIWE